MNTFETLSSDTVVGCMEWKLHTCKKLSVAALKTISSFISHFIRIMENLNYSITSITLCNIPTQPNESIIWSRHNQKVFTARLLTFVRWFFPKMKEKFSEYEIWAEEKLFTFHEKRMQHGSLMTKGIQSHWECMADMNNLHSIETSNFTSSITHQKKKLTPPLGKVSITLQWSLKAFCGWITSSSFSTRYDADGSCHRNLSSCKQHTHTRLGRKNEPTWRVSVTFLYERFRLPSTWHEFIVSSFNLLSPLTKHIEK